MDEGTFTAAGIDALAANPATTNIAINHVQPPRPSRWVRFLAWFGLANA
ncbi:MAG: hypothetical protein ACTH4Y_08395 [Microbacterium gubbeenense]